MQYYKSLNQNFSRNGDIKLQPIRAELNIELGSGVCEIEVDLEYDKQNRWSKIENFGVIKCDVCYSNRQQLFRVYDIEKDMFKLTIKARHIFFDLVKHVILDNRAVNMNGQQALEKILAGTKFTAHSDIQKINNCYFVNMNSVQALNGSEDNTFRSRWGGEMLYDNFDIYVNNRIGSDNGVRISYARNLLDVSLIENIDNIVTRAYPRASEGISLPEGYVDSELINKYPLCCENFIDCGDMKLKNEENNEGYDTKEELFNAMRNKVKQMYSNGLDKPSISGTVKLAELENSLEYKHIKNLVKVNIGDTVTVKHENIGINLKTRCVALKWDILNKRNIETTLGDIQTSYFDRQTITADKVDNILNPNNTVNAERMEGIINALDTKFKAMRDISQKSQVKALLFEDKVKGSSTYGALCLGSMGFEIASERTSDNKGWKWRTFGSGQGFVADEINTGILSAIKIMNKDDSFEIDLSKSGGALFKNNKKDAIRIANNAINMYDWKDSNKEIGGLMSLHDGKPVVSLANEDNSLVSIAYKKDNKSYLPYMTFDKSNSSNPITIWDNVILKGNITINGVIKNKEGNSVFDPSAPQATGGIDGNDGLREKVVNSARKLIGKPYVWGGNYPPLGSNIGTDCSGLMQWSYHDNGINITRTTYTQIREGFEVTENQLKLGDLIFPNINHVFMYSGFRNGQHWCVEAPHTGLSIRERAFNWTSGYRARRIIKDAPKPSGDTSGLAGSVASANIIYYVKGIEGFAPNYYHDSVGVRTLGYGMTGAELSGVGVPMSETSATHYLTNNFNRDYYSPVLRIVRSRGVSNPKQREIDAFSSFAYNLGVGCFQGSTLLKLYARGERGESIHQQIAKYCHAGGSVLAGLVRRREEEWRIFAGQGGVQGYNFAPSIQIIGGRGTVRDNNGYGAKPY